MTLKNILLCENIKKIDIMYRCNAPDGESTMLEGYVRYENGELIYLDDDYYSLNDEIESYYFYNSTIGERCLCVIEKVNWG